MLYKKNGSTLAREMALPDGPTPRVGEVIALPDLTNDCGGLHTFLVLDVCWLLKDGRLTPELTARACEPVHHRQEFLAEMGWLAPAPTAE